MGKALDDLLPFLLAIIPIIGARIVKIIERRVFIYYATHNDDSHKWMLRLPLAIQLAIANAIILDLIRQQENTEKENGHESSQ